MEVDPNVYADQIWKVLETIKHAFAVNIMKKWNQDEAASPLVKAFATAYDRYIINNDNLTAEAALIKACERHGDYEYMCLRLGIEPK